MDKEQKAEGAAMAPAPAFTKGQLLGSGRYAGRRDMLSALLEDGMEYTHADVGKLIESFMKGKVG